MSIPGGGRHWSPGAHRTADNPHVSPSAPAQTLQHAQTPGFKMRLHPGGPRGLGHLEGSQGGHAKNFRRTDLDAVLLRASTAVGPLTTRMTTATTTVSRRAVFDVEQHMTEVMIVRGRRRQVLRFYWWF